MGKIGEGRIQYILMSSRRFLFYAITTIVTTKTTTTRIKIQ